jgi:hypothetical protein
MEPGGFVGLAGSWVVVIPVVESLVNALGLLLGIREYSSIIAGASVSQRNIRCCPDLGRNTYLYAGLPPISSR